MAETSSLTTPGGETLIDRITEAAQRGGVVRFVQGDRVTTTSWAELYDDARRWAAALSDREIGPGRHVAVLGTTSQQVVTTIEATWLAGATAMVLPLPMRLGSVEEFVTQTRSRVLSGDTALLVIDDDLAAFYEPSPDDPPIVLMSELAEEAASRHPDEHDIPTIDPRALAVLQFTSGRRPTPRA